MKIFFTQQATDSLRECIDFLGEKISDSKRSEVFNRILEKIEKLADNPWIGQTEEYLEHLSKSHRRVIDGNYKIIYRVENDIIYITDIFDTRQDPSKMKG
jgi:toxin ParE1/3/4